MSSINVCLVLKVIRIFKRSQVVWIAVSDADVLVHGGARLKLHENRSDISVDVIYLGVLTLASACPSLTLSPPMSTRYLDSFQIQLHHPIALLLESPYSDQTISQNYLATSGKEKH